MARFAKRSGGFFSLSDFEPAEGGMGRAAGRSYRDVTIYNTPPPTQGFTVIEMLNLLEPHKLHRKPSLDRITSTCSCRRSKLPTTTATDCWLTRTLRTFRSRGSYRRSMRVNEANLIDPQVGAAWDKVPSFGSLAGRHRLCCGSRSGRQRRVADPKPVRTVWISDRGWQDRRDPAKQGRLFFARPASSQSPRARKDPAAHAHRLDRPSEKTNFGAFSVAWVPMASRRSSCRPMLP